jgi:hypothetical protein
VNPALSGSTYFISDMYGRNVLSRNLTSESSNINISELAAGAYILKVGEQNLSNKFLKK